MELVLLLVLAVCVIALIRITQKLKALEEESDSTITNTSGTSRTSSSTINDKKEEEGLPQNTIYEFSEKSEKRLCPFCDGENSLGAKVCIVCGREL